MHDFHEIRGGEDGAPRDDAHVFTEHIRLQIRGQDDHDNATAVLKKLKLLVKLKTDKNLQALHISAFLIRTIGMINHGKSWCASSTSGHL